MINKNHLESEIKESIQLYNQGHFKKASELTNMLCNKYPNIEIRVPKIIARKEKKALKNVTITITILLSSLSEKNPIGP